MLMMKKKMLRGFMPLVGIIIGIIMMSGVVSGGKMIMGSSGGGLDTVSWVCYYIPPKHHN